MTSCESTEDRLGKTEVTTVFFKKLGEKLRNYQRYKKPVQLSESSSVHSCSLDLHSNVKVSEESIASDKLQNIDAKQIVEMKSKDRERKQEIEKDKRRKKNKMKEKLVDSKKAKVYSKWEDEEKQKKTMKPSVHPPSPISPELRNHLQEGKGSENDESSTTATASSLETSVGGVKLADKFHESAKTTFNLGNNNTLSILKFKNDPNAIVYDLQNSNGCKIYLERTANRAVLLTVDSTGKRLYISCDF